MFIDPFKDLDSLLNFFKFSIDLALAATLNPSRANFNASVLPIPVLAQVIQIHLLISNIYII